MAGQSLHRHALLRRPDDGRERKSPISQAPLSRRQIVVATVIWLSFFVASLWLAAHDPDYLSRIVERALGGAA